MERLIQLRFRDMGTSLRREPWHPPLAIHGTRSDRPLLPSVNLSLECIKYLFLIYPLRSGKGKLHESFCGRETKVCRHYFAFYPTQNMLSSIIKNIALHFIIVA